MAGHESPIGEMRNTHKILIGKKRKRNYHLDGLCVPEGKGKVTPAFFN